MIALVVGTSLVAAAALLFYGRKALRRIRHWGDHMNERDAISDALNRLAPPGNSKGPQPVRASPRNHRHSA